jgi:ribosomal protein L7/L12
MTKQVLMALSVLGLVTLAGSASAEEQAGVTTLKPITVVGKRVRPSVAIEVARAKADIKLQDLQDPKVEQIMRAAAKAPF